MKKCVKCKVEKNDDEFHKDRLRPDGLFPYCRACRGCKKLEKHLNKTRQGYLRWGAVWHHRFVIEQALGRKLGRYEVVHHKNGIRDDNRLENLEVMSLGDHSRHHQSYKDAWKFVKSKKFNCQICGLVFESKHYAAKYCSPHCVYQANKEYVKSWKLKKLKYANL